MHAVCNGDQFSIVKSCNWINLKSFFFCRIGCDAISLLLTHIDSGKCLNSSSTIVRWPPRIAAYNGVYLVISFGRQSAPFSIKYLTKLASPFWQDLQKLHREFSKTFVGVSQTLDLSQWCAYKYSNVSSSSGVKFIACRSSFFSTAIICFADFSSFFKIDFLTFSYAFVNSFLSEMVNHARISFGTDVRLLIMSIVSQSKLPFSFSSNISIYFKFWFMHK